MNGRGAPVPSVIRSPIPQEHPMTAPQSRRRIALAGVVAAAALGSAAPAQAAPPAERCDARLERIEDRFREIERAPRLRGRRRVVERPRLAQVLRELRDLIMAITDIDEPSSRRSSASPPPRLGAALNAALVTSATSSASTGRWPTASPCHAGRARRPHRHPGALRARVAQRPGRQRLRRLRPGGGGLRAAARARARPRRRGRARSD